MLRNASSKAPAIYVRNASLQHLRAAQQIVRPRSCGIKGAQSLSFAATKRPKNQVKVACYHSTKDTVSPYEGDTIYALSTAPGRAGIAIVRISGPGCVKIYQSLCPSKAVPRPRYASLRTLYHPSTAFTRILDSDALVLYFPSPSTVTGEDVLELHIHGGPATIKAVLSAIPQCTSNSLIRYAEPGEFTRRAFHNNRLDLAQVEALSDTLSAETEQQRLAAVRGNSGNLGRKYEAWRQQLLFARGELEALIDFSEDQHFDESPSELLTSVASQVRIILDSIAQHDAASQCGELLKRGIRISLLGPPNAGKSSLLNRIVGREASIVSQEAGTTRDIVEVSLDIGGYLCTFADTAGLRTEGSSADKNSVIGAIEQEGIRRAKAKAGESDMIVAMGSVEPANNDLGWKIHYDSETLEIAAKARQALVIVNKIDSIPPELLATLLSDFQSVISTYRNLTSQLILPISCRSISISPSSATKSTTSSNDRSLPDSSNIPSFIKTLTESFQSLTTLPPDMQDLVGVTARQRSLLSSCAEHLHAFMAEAQIGADRQVDADCDVEADIVIAAEHLRSAAICLARITGRGEGGDVEEVLGVVFEKFCVGK